MSNNFIYTSKVDKFLKQHLFKNQNSISNKEFNIKYNSTSNEIYELLLRHDGVAFHVDGENFPLALLIREFGLKGFEELLEQDSIRFILWTTMLTTFASDDFPKGVLPLQSGNLTSTVHKDPEESAVSGLKALVEPIPRRKRRELVRKLEKYYDIVTEDLSKKAQKIGHDSYTSNKFSNLGLPNIKDFADFKSEDRRLLLRLAGQILELSVLSMFKYNTNNNYDVLSLNQVEFERLKKSKKLEEYQNEIFELQGIPDFKEMINLGYINKTEIPKLRSTKNAENFRKWINEVANKDEFESISKEYIEAITKKGFIETKTGKLVKTLAVSGFSTVLGTVIGGPAGGVVGAATGKLLEPIADFGIDIVDTFVLDGLLKGWNPKHFFDEDISKIIKPNRSI